MKLFFKKIFLLAILVEAVFAWPGFPPLGPGETNRFDIVKTADVFPDEDSRPEGIVSDELSKIWFSGELHYLDGATKVYVPAPLPVHPSEK